MAGERSGCPRGLGGSRWLRSKSHSGRSARALIDDALQRLAAIDLRKSQIVELRFFGGLTVDETAEVMKLAPITIMLEWRTAKAWLSKETFKIN